MWPFYSILDNKQQTEDRTVSILSARQAASIWDWWYIFAKHIRRSFSKAKLGNFKVLVDSDYLTGACSCETKLPESLNINLLVTKPQVYAASWKY